MVAVFVQSASRIKHLSSPTLKNHNAFSYVTMVVHYLIVGKSRCCWRSLTVWSLIYYMHLCGLSLRDFYKEEQAHWQLLLTLLDNFIDVTGMMTMTHHTTN